MSKSAMIRLLAFMALLVSYIGLGLIMIYDREIDRSGVVPFAAIWVLGAISVGLNMYNGYHQKAKPYLLVLLALSGLVWLFPPLLFTYLGIPSLLCFLIVALVVITPKLDRKSFNLEDE